MLQVLWSHRGLNMIKNMTLYTSILLKEVSAIVFSAWMDPGEGSPTQLTSLFSYTHILKNVAGRNSQLTDDQCRLYERKGLWVIVFLMDSDLREVNKLCY